MKRKTKLVSGIGVNDADYAVTGYTKINGSSRRIWSCPIYLSWCNMLRRASPGDYQNKFPTYSGCSVADEWLSFSSFSAWMLSQDWENNHLDKDLLFPGNKEYRPDRCVFVSPRVNIFIIDSGASRGIWPIGVHWVARDKKFQASCRNPFSNKQESLGLYLSPEDAHRAWRRRKHEHALRYAEMQSDPRIADALRTRYLTIEDIDNAIA